MDENKKTNLHPFAMDACRPGHDDFRLPELAELASELKNRPDLAERCARLQRCDAQLQAAIHDVEVPLGARERLLQRLQAKEPLSPASSSANMVAATSAPASVGRRWWPLAIAASLLIGTTFLLVSVWNSSSSVDVHLTARTFYEQIQGSAWKDVLEARPSIALPSNLAFRPRHWQPVTFNGLTGVAYRIALPHARGILFVCALPKGLQLPSAPPVVPETLYESRSIAVWRSGEQLCMLVAEGGEEMYRDLIRAANGPIAWLKDCRFRKVG
jgi:hypothetical protein